MRLIRRLIGFSLTNDFGIERWRINSTHKQAIGISLPTDQLPANNLFHEPKNEIHCKLTLICFYSNDLIHSSLLLNVTIYCILQIVFACLLALAAAAAEVKPKAEGNVEVSADQDVAEWRQYYGGHRGYWRGRRSAEETKPEEATVVEASPDQEANEWYGRRYHGYYPYSYYGSYGHWRGRRSAEEKVQVEVDADQDANEWYGRGYYGRYPYGYRSYYGRYGPSYSRHW